MKVAFTTSNGTYVNTNFGLAKEIDVYKVCKDGFNFVETIIFEEKETSTDDNIASKIAAIIDCKILYVKAIGKDIGNKLMKKGVTIIRAQEYDRIPDILYMLVRSMNGNPPPRLRKVIEQQNNYYVSSSQEEMNISSGMLS
jgi:nitrogen fixation protein NifX